MRNALKLSTLTLAAAIAAVPAFAQTKAAPASQTPPTVAPSVATPAITAPPLAGPGVTPTLATTPSDRNPVLTDRAEARVSKIVGSSVYNDHNEKVGTVDDVLIGKDHKPSEAILSVGGFLGMGQKLVAVPYGDLHLGNASAGDNRVVLNGATKQSLKAMNEYHHTAPSRG